MVPLTMLWLPILVSSVIVFVASTLFWMVIKHHAGDYRQIPNEERVLEVLGAGDPSPGLYSFPYVRDWKSITPELKKQIEEGPGGFLIVRRPGPLSMTPQLVQYFIYLVGVSLMVAYVSGRALPASADYLAVFRIAGTTAILGYAAALFTRSIWFYQPWRVTLKEVFDGVVYGLLTAGVFGWLWPRGVDI